MKLTKLAFLAGLAGLIFGSDGNAQEIRQPNTVQNVAYDYFSQPAEASPSDKPMTAAVTGTQQQPAQNVPAPLATDCTSAGGVSYCDSADGMCCQCHVMGNYFGTGDCDPCRLFAPVGNGWQLSGWLNAGGVASTDTPNSRFLGPFNWVYRNDATLNQAYATFGKQTCTDGCGWDFGGRVDALYGTDFRFVQARGLELNPDGTNGWNNHRFYGLALPQAYAEIARNDVSVKVGHFYSIVGYESTMAPQNFFYTKSYAFQYSGPFTLTGALATWNYSDEWQFLGGVHNGWDNFDPQIDVTGFVGGAVYKPCDRPWKASFTLIEGDEPNFNAANNGRSNRWLYAAIWEWDINCCWQYAIEHRYGFQHDGQQALNNIAVVAPRNTQWYGINQYLYKKINDCWRAGARVEWFRDDDGSRVAGRVPGNPNVGPYPGNFYEVSLGLNWTPKSNLIVRPEVRWDRFSGGGQLPFNDGTKDDQFLAAIDAILVW